MAECMYFSKYNILLKDIGEFLTHEIGSHYAQSCLSDQFNGFKSNREKDINMN